MSQQVIVLPVLVGIEALKLIIEAARDIGLSIAQQKSLTSDDGTNHAIEAVVTDSDGTTLGIRRERDGTCAFVSQKCGDARSAELANRITQRYVYSRTLGELQRKGYRVTTEEKQKDGTVHLVAERWK